MERKQVNLDLGTNNLTPAAARGGQYSVAVASTPKTNAAMQLSQALRVAPQILGQASNIAKQMGEDAASEVVDVEAAMADDGVKGILGYDKAYQQGLVKRHFVQNEGAIKERFLNKARSEEALQMTPNEFIASLDAERGEFVSELMDSFGGNNNREEAVNALTASFVDELRNQATAEFITNKKDQALMMISADTQNVFSNQGVTAGLEYMRSEMAAIGVDMKPSERAQKMRDAVTSNVTAMAVEGRYAEAAKVIEDAEKFGIQGAGPLFGSTKGQDDLVTAKRALQKAREAAEESFSDNSAGVERSVDALMQDIASQASPEARVASAQRLADRAGVAPELAAEFVEAASEGGIDNFITAYREMTRNTTNEGVRDLLNDQLGEINRAKKEYFGGSVSTIGTFSETEVSQLEADIREVLDRNPKTGRTLLPVTAGGRRMNVTDPDYIDMMKRVERDYEWATVPSQRGSIVTTAQKDIRSKDARFGAYANEYAVAIESELNEMAPRLYREAKGDITAYESALQANADRLTGEYKRRATLRGNTQSLLDINLSDAKEIEAIKAPESGKPKKTVRDLVSFGGGEVRLSDVTSDRETIRNLTAGKNGLPKADKKRLLQASLIRWGLPTMDSIDLDMLNEADMGFGDVLLGASVIKDANLASEYYDNDKPTAEQKAAYERWTELGFDSYEDFTTLAKVQSAIRNLNNR